MVRPATRYDVDPGDPRAPAQEVWDRLDAGERQRILAALPSEIERATPPEGDDHSNPKLQARLTLEEYFRRSRRQVYLASELPVYYPAEPMFAPDLLAVVDCDPHARDHWTVSHEGRGLDVVLEITVQGSARKDFEDNVVRYASLGIPEYFAYAPRRERLAGWHLPAGARRYEPIEPRDGRLPSALLGVELAVENGRLRFYAGSAALLDVWETISRLGAIASAATRRAEDEARRAEDEARRAEDEARRAEDEARRAEDEARRAERYAARLREAGIDPDE